MPLKYVSPRNSISIEDGGSSLRIVIPDRFDGRISCFIILFLGVLLGLLPFVLPKDFFSGVGGTIMCTVLLFIPIVLLFSLPIFLLNPNSSHLLRELFNHEILIVTNEALYLTRGRGNQPVEYLFAHIQNFCPCPNFRTFYLIPTHRTESDANIGAGFKYASGGGLSFLYDGAEVRFANGADAPEARRILNAIQEKFPQYKAVISPTIGYTD